MASEESVLGLAIGDPEVLKATQFVLTSVGITAFFLVLELMHVFEVQGFHDWTHLEVFLWVIDTLRALAITVSGYLGIKWSHRIFLGCFCAISLISSLVALITCLSDFFSGVVAGVVVLRFFASVFFALGGYFSWMLFQRAKEGALIGGGGSTPANKDAYSLLGIPMMDLQVLKATQSVFTSLGIVVCLLGSFVIVGFQGAITEGKFTILWFFCLGIVISMSYTAVTGITRSSSAMLTCFICLSGSFCGFFLLATLLTVLTCGTYCLTSVMFDLFVVGVFGTALQSAMFLRRKLAEGVSLTATIQDDGEEELGPVPAERLGASTADERPPTVDMEAGATQNGVEEF
mmetsp:Transcript_27983/g.55018  ORF Transcript_27983/g.55018 Transcript_27983/m.55018 type:complete len:346 (-) Transcript_27983:142-1179(-)